MSTDLYRYFDKDSVLLYVGISFHAVVRAYQHKNNAHWWDRVATMSRSVHPSRKAAERAECEAISTENPIYNLRGKKTLDEAAFDTCVSTKVRELRASLSDMEGLTHLLSYSARHDSSHWLKVNNGLSRHASRLKSQFNRAYPICSDETDRQDYANAIKTLRSSRKRILRDLVQMVDQSDRAAPTALRRLSFQLTYVPIAIRLRWYKGRKKRKATQLAVIAAASSGNSISRSVVQQAWRRD